MYHRHWLFSSPFVDFFVSIGKVTIHGNKDKSFFGLYYQLGKAHKLPFNNSTSMTTKPLEDGHLCFL